MTGMVEHIHREEDAAMREKMARTYAIAHRHNRRGYGSVAIHVGQDVWDWMQRQATVPGAPKVNTAWGFPVLLELAWPKDQVAVRTSEVIV